MGGVEREQSSNDVRDGEEQEGVSAVRQPLALINGKEGNGCHLSSVGM